MRSRRWGPTSTKGCSFLEPLNPNAQSDDMTTKVLLGREALATSKHDAFLSSQVSAEASLREESTTPVVLLFFERMQELLSLLRRYMKRWRQFAHEHNILFFLEGIQRGAVIKQVLRMFYKWFLFASRSAAVRNMEHSLMKEASLRLASRYLKLWRMAVELRQKRSRQILVLRGIRYGAERSLARRQYLRWRAAARRKVELRRRLAVLSESRTIHLAHFFFVTWMRWRQRNFYTTQLGLIKYAAFRSLARCTLQRWGLLLSRRIVARDMERCSLERFVGGFLLRWRRYAHTCKSLRFIGHKAYWRVARRAFGKWKMWLVRIVVTLQLEKRNTVLLVQVYFFRWLMFYRVHRLDYNAFLSSFLL
ncbi:hypothetical protein C3747_29g196 [Trypanosoma cruzi]|uniref:Sfi1 spindle body domain-containing protein n=2 Tax=Trypanosoma cruzi TaxID=5693 RepID=Q4DEE0_TRYCC|nr:hypothetical protein, conserved [Trypanosoma cruzi]EAN90889.1 hypothetical protein, conserved [Trypanosoma cruzi]PWV15418.1 hypothetical protein C3747_29g196 [Trypanosoma cruzi]RNC57090.1 hypothetical protein TcCL_ESM05354 [Trypanosoma cruzi]|eukprot:XP_812740.1 hypothetical protein [Trypanosoma cruzi strain CL Brener]